ncbi:hypothetical protein VD0002_g1490 [Verticillium dahliae]|uniref:Uncharacterized protein n=1 Tax=Verticillium dahliae TaxID=27337 RepID=A0A2J8DZN9_VERDA|nr:hypothetical protein VdG2_01564 [Verticillium dahliae VDG2]KAF3352442.1 hypothetical protein VdG1_09129 [Verticillium dahliae VDG1]KAH6685150.1 hypothetical protein EV126DRAFT_434628 [Verticillium dahliae]PNH27726.1 hypothetical protein BJF96_g9007 [Verticillium dahliae]PNH46535.1 hypothetical protein VD0004_g1627 [Verticillium dahliae]
MPSTESLQPLTHEEPPLPPPSSQTIFIADNWPPFVGAAVVAQIAHYRHLGRKRTTTPNLRNARFWALAGGGWMITYLGIVTSIAVAQAKVNHYRDPKTRGLYS